MGKILLVSAQRLPDWLLQDALPPIRGTDEGVRNFRCRRGKSRMEDIRLNSLRAGGGAVAPGHEERSAGTEIDEFPVAQWALRDVFEPVRARNHDDFRLFEVLDFERQQPRTRGKKPVFECIHNRAEKRRRHKQPIREEEDEETEKNTAAEVTLTTRPLEEGTEASDGEDSSQSSENSVVESAAQSPLSQKHGAPRRLGDPNAGCSKRKWMLEEEDTSGFQGLVSLLKAHLEESLQMGLHSLISVLKSKEESEQKYRQKLLSLEEQKLSLKQEKLQNHRRDRVRAQYKRLHRRITPTPPNH